jgi:hypothetical protein
MVLTCENLYYQYISLKELISLPMLDDPEAQSEEWEDNVFADSLAEAERKCQQLAEKYTKQSGSLVSATAARNIKGKLYKCKLKSEVRDE